MKRSATIALAAAAALVVALPAQMAAQNPPPPGQASADAIVALRARLDANAGALIDAEQKCQLERYKSLLQEAYQLLVDSGRLLDSIGNAADQATYRRARSLNFHARDQYDRAQSRLPLVEQRCRKAAPATGGDVGAVGSTTPPPAPEQFRMPLEKEEPLSSLEYLQRWAQFAYGLHTLAAAACDLAAMRSQRSRLEIFSRAAEQYASKVRRQAAKNPNPQGERVIEANRYAKAILTLWHAALGQPPLNCPGSTGTAIQPPPPPPPPPPKPTGGTKDCPAPGKSAPEHGMRFTPPDDKSQRMLALHNRARAEVGVAPLIWDRELAAGAAAHATQMSTVGRVHAPRAGRKCVRENLLQSLRGGRSPEQMIAVWVSERAYFKPGIFPNVSTTGDWARVGHYTQVIWSTTTHVGCAVHSDARHDWTVCRYSPPGNQDGRPVL